MEQATAHLAQSAQHLEAIKGTQDEAAARITLSAKEREAAHKHLAELLALTEEISEHTTVIKNHHDASLKAAVTALNEAKESLQALLSVKGAARWRQCVDHAEEKVRSIDAITDTLKLHIAGVGEAFQKRVDAACKEITKARGLAVGRLWSVYQQFFGWVVGTMLVAVLLSALLASWMTTGRAPWVTFSEHSRLRTNASVIEKAWPHLSASERARIKEAANR
jgi:hypothetical protein